MKSDIDKLLAMVPGDYARTEDFRHLVARLKMPDPRVEALRAELEQAESHIDSLTADNHDFAEQVRLLQEEVAALKLAAAKPKRRPRKPKEE